MRTDTDVPSAHTDRPVFVSLAPQPLQQDRAHTSMAARDGPAQNYRKAFGVRFWVPFTSPPFPLPPAPVSTGEETQFELLRPLGRAGSTQFTSSVHLYS